MLDYVAEAGKWYETTLEYDIVGELAQVFGYKREPR